MFNGFDVADRVQQHKESSTNIKSAITVDWPGMILHCAAALLSTN